MEEGHVRPDSSGSRFAPMLSGEMGVLAEASNSSESGIKWIIREAG